MTSATCYHKTKRVVWTSVNKHLEPLANPVLRHQCSDCGKILPQSLPHSMALPATPQVDLVAAKRWAECDLAELGVRSVENQQIAALRREQWWRSYNEYLASEQWQHKRALVFARSNGLCEGCRTKKATQVHHLSYQHLGNELLWELAAVCKECHDLAHTDRDGNITDPRDKYPVFLPRPVLRNLP